MKQAKWILDYLSEQQIAEISNYVKASEQKTMGEIVPVIVRRSSQIRHVPVVVALLLLVVFLLVESSMTDFLFVWPGQLWWPVVFGVAWGLGLLLSKFRWVQRFFIPDADEIEQVLRRAQLEFFINRVDKTKEGTGILIFVSAMERRAFVWADGAVSEKVPAEEWDRIVDEMTGRFRQGDWFLGLKEAISDCGVILSKHFPSQKENPNELSNSLIVKD